MKKTIIRQRVAPIYRKSDRELFNEGLLNPYCYNFGLKIKNNYEEGKTNCISDNC